MNAATSRATVDSYGRLVSADPALAALNTRAGGRIGAPLAVPALAGAARLARRLGVMVSRPVLVSDGDADIELWVKAQMTGGEVRLAVSGWRVQRPWAPDRVKAPSAPERWDWQTDAALRLTHIAPASAAREGLDVDAVLGQPLTALFRLEPDTAGGLPLVNALAERVDLTGQRARIQANGRPVLLDACVWRDGAGAFAGFAGNIRADEAISGGNALLTQGFVQGLDRALRRPLAQIIAHADSMHAETEGAMAPNYAGYAADIAGAGRHLLGLVDDLVDLQAIERPDFTVPVEDIDLADLARRAAGLLSVRADDAGVTIERPQPGVSVSAKGDFRRVLQILVNLIGNAVRFAPPGSAVSVTVGDVGGRPSATVRDEGRGISPIDAERVFGKFERVDPGESGGSGLGLYIARRLARAMGGDLTLESASGEGACFTLTLAAG